MKLLITIMSSLLFMLQIPIQAVDELDNNPQSTTTSTSDINNIINIYKMALDNQEDEDIVSIADDLLDNFVETKDFKIINTLLLKDKDDNTFLHYGAYNGNRRIIQKTINALIEGKQTALLEKLLMVMDNYDRTFLHYGAYNGNSGIIQTTINALIEGKQTSLLEKLLMVMDNDDRTFLHYAAFLGKSNIIQSTIKALVEYKQIALLENLLMSVDKNGNKLLNNTVFVGRDNVHTVIFGLKDEHKELFEKLLLSSNASGKTFLHMAALDLDRNIDSLRITINALIEDKQIELLEKLLFSTDNSGGTFLHSTAESPSGYLPDIIKITSDVFKNNHSHFLKRLLMSVDNSGHTFLHRSAVLGNNKTDDVHQTLKQNLDAQFIDDTQLFSLKNRAHYKILHIIKNTKQLIKEVIINIGYLF